MQLSDLIKEMMENPSPIRQIMKMASRKNIINMGLDPDEIISYGGGWVGHHAPELLRSKYMEITGNIEKFHLAGGYSPTLGFDDAREAIANMENYLFGSNVKEENVIIGQSSTQLTHDLFVTLLNNEDTIMLFDPTYANYPGQIKMALKNARIARLKVLDDETWQYKDDEQLSEEFKELYEAEKPKIVLFPSPDNPSSQVFGDAFVKTIYDECYDNDAAMVIDYAYKTQVFGTIPSYFSWSPDSKPNMIGIYSNSKWARGLGRRLGWVVASVDVIDALERTQQGSILCPDSMHQMALVSYLNEAIKDGSLKKYMQEVKQAYEKAADATIKAIDEHLGFPRLIPQGGLYTLMKVGEDGNEFVKRVLKNTGVLFIPGEGFGSTLKNGVRISYGPMVESIEKIEEGFKRVAEYLKK